MKYDPEIHHRRSIRLRGYDYSQAGAYFVTICTHNRECLYGEMIDAKMVLIEFGETAKTEWTKTAVIRPNIVVDQFVIMPNHLHGIICIYDHDVTDVGAHCDVPLRNVPPTNKHQSEQFGKSTKNSIPTIVKLLKATVTKQINEMRQTPGHPVWQRNYFERVIRNEKEFNRIRE